MAEGRSRPERHCSPRLYAREGGEGDAGRLGQSKQRAPRETRVTRETTRTRGVGRGRREAREDPREGRPQPTPPAPTPLSGLWPDQPPKGQLFAHIKSMFNLREGGSFVERVPTQGGGGGGRRNCCQTQQPQQRTQSKHAMRTLHGDWVVVPPMRTPELRSEVAEVRGLELRRNE